MLKGLLCGIDLAEKNETSAIDDIPILYLILRTTRSLSVV